MGENTETRHLTRRVRADDGLCPGHVADRSFFPCPARSPAKHRDSDAIGRVPRSQAEPPPGARSGTWSTVRQSTGDSTAAAERAHRERAQLPNSDDLTSAHPPGFNRL